MPPLVPPSPLQTLIAGLAVALALALPASAAERLPAQLEAVDVADRLGAQVDGALPFVDHTGAEVTLGQLFDGERPVLLTLNYFRCSTLCSIQLNHLTEALRALELDGGFQVVTVSFDPTDDTERAAAKRASYLDSLGGEAALDWTFLTGAAGDIEALTSALGYGYQYDAETKQYAHSPVVYVLSPKGRISRYVFGLGYSPRDVRFALIEASEGQIGSVFDKIILSCFHYVSADGAYTPFAFGIMRLGGGLVVLVLGSFLLVYWRRERRRPKALAESTP